jgi:hypothetical protein
MSRISERVTLSATPSAAVGLLLLLAVGAGGWAVRGGGAAEPKKVPAVAVARDSADGFSVWFDGTVVGGGEMWTDIDVDPTSANQIVRIDPMAWGSGPGVSIPPPKGTMVCAFVNATTSAIRSGHFTGGKVFVGSTCTSSLVSSAG